MTHVTLSEAAARLGYSRGTLHSYLTRRPNPPEPVGRRGNARLYDLTQLEAWLGPGRDVVNRRSTIAGDTIRCLECGRVLRSLAGHLRVHGLTAMQYRERHRLPRTASLSSMPARRAIAAATGAETAGRLVHDPVVQARRARAAVEHTRVAHMSPVVVEHRAPGQARAVEAMQAVKRAERDARLRAAGYGSVGEAVGATAHLSTRAAAARLGVSASTVRRWRKGE